MGRNVKQLKNYTTEQVETLFESDENNVIGVKLYAIIQLTRGYSTRKLEEFYRVTHKQICNRADRFDAEGIDGLRIKPGQQTNNETATGYQQKIENFYQENKEVYEKTSCCQR